MLCYVAFGFIFDFGIDKLREPLTSVTNFTKDFFHLAFYIFIINSSLLAGFLLILVVYDIQGKERIKE